MSKEASTDAVKKRELDDDALLSQSIQALRCAPIRLNGTKAAVVAEVMQTRSARVATPLPVS